MTRITDGVARWSKAALLALCALPSVAAPEAFWRLIGQLAAAIPQGGKAIAQQWPGKSFSLAGGAHGGSAPVTLAPGLQTAIDELRLAEGDSVQLLVLKLEGSCITPADVSARYPQLRSRDFPQPDNPDPVSYRSVDIDGVRVAFGFRGARPGCLAHVVFDPQAH